MFKFLDLNSLKVVIATDEEIITKGVVVNISENMSISTLGTIMRDAVKNLVADVNDDKVYNFAISVQKEDYSELNEEVFESAVSCALASFFDALVGKLGRPRARRLDVPEHLKRNINCNMSLLKRAINYQTVVNNFQLEIVGRGFMYNLVGDPNE